MENQLPSVGHDKLGSTKRSRKSSSLKYIISEQESQDDSDVLPGNNREAERLR